MIQHIVCFKFNDDASAEAIQQHMSDFAALKAQIPQIADYSAGMMLDTEETSKDYDCLHRVVFANQDDLDIYLPHEAHQAFIERNKAIWESVIVFDAAIENGIE